MFRVTTSGYLVECESCGNEELAPNLRMAKSAFDFHECSDNPRKVLDCTLVEASDPVELVKPMFSTDIIGRLI
jgi:hypothetical protein